jgi:signal transduction histidine kinase
LCGKNRYFPSGWFRKKSQTSGGSTTTIAAECHDTTVTIAINGNGPGTGLGISISQQIIEENHGNLTVESDGATGTTFTIVLPLENRMDYMFNAI